MPPKKRPKVVDNDDDDDDDDNTVMLIDKVWEHYRNYHESCQEEENEEGDMDELLELIHLVEDSKIAPVAKQINKKDGDDDTIIATSLFTTLKTRKDLLPIVVSMAHLQLANDVITQTVDQNDPEAVIIGEEEQAASVTILDHLQQSLRYFPYNCAAWSMGANYARMERLVEPMIIVQWYQRAAKYASTLRTQAVEILEQTDDDDDDENETLIGEKTMYKEWIELLIIVDMVDAEYMDHNNSDDDDDDNENGDEKEEEDDDDEEDGYYSTSSVEAASRFMSAMLLSTLGKHNDAKQELDHFDLSHRVHPNVWQGGDTSTTNALTTTTTDTKALKENDQVRTNTPSFFSGGVLPQDIYEKMCQIFAPDAVYWKESNYAHRGYYSYFFDINENNLTTTNLVEDVIIHYLLPLAKQYLKEGGNNNDDKIVGAEWWTHHRPIQANLGHNLHFDTDEAILAQEGLISHPVLSSVLYLTGGDESSSSPSGPTIVFDQTPDSKEVADKCWSCVPKNNAFMIFDGELLHGVLPCPGDKEAVQNESRDKNGETSGNLSWSQETTNKTTSPPHRLTFMVGFWTRRVPEKMKNRRLYGPCGPLPDAKTTEWVKQIQECSSLKQGTAMEISKNVQESKLVPISPAWETLNTCNHDNHNNASRNEPLDIPRALDHRFFVKDAPLCFRSSLFEKDIEDFDDHNDIAAK